ncbi:ralBP1-associated Eps domain-containing protein 1 [Musca vetustissima]|uniref:ralBP1-associated Eps domain-containing protein 1 n=1 Tax=Musca vetustissima TaxID=27455 RepID=UPI002AB5FD59|nr:ralBP1-associated Eps domain-containing protein 1 [Musca vetustissima]
MEEVSLTETESRYYGDLFLCCDEEKTGKIPMLKASELFRSANLSNEKILEIISLAGIPDTAIHVSRAQFYSCLKLIAAHQASMQLRQELIAASVQLPLPRFSWNDNGSKLEVSSHQQHHHAIPPPPVTDRRNSLQRRTDWTDTNPLGSRRNSSTTHPQKSEACAASSDLQSTDSEVEQCESSCGGEEGHRGGGSPEAWSTNSDSPTPTPTNTERPWAKETLWQGLLGDEHRQLLGTEEESSDRHSSDDDDEDDNETDLEAVYQITPEQREYYFNQFKSVHHDTKGLLSGQAARVFFEKSRIPVEELRHIWQLCDVTRDGALSLAEFTAAMHLVVLRRNNIPLPATLPQCLHPTVLQRTTLANHMLTQEPAEADLLHLDEDEEDNTDNTIVGMNTGMSLTGNSVNSVRILNENAVMNMSTLSASSQASASSRQYVTTTTKNPHSLSPPTIPPPPPVKNRSISNSPKMEQPTTSPPLNISSSKPIYSTSKDSSLWSTTVGNDEPLQLVTTTDTQPSQWTKFNESPTSNVSSPGPKPVNFDMQRTAQAVVSDPQILHPVPLRVTPVGGVVTTNAAVASAIDKHNLESSADSVHTLRESSPKSSAFASSNTSQHRDSLQNSDLRAIQRPQAKKIPPKNIGAIPPPPQREPATVATVAASNMTAHVADNSSSSGGANILSTSMLISKKDPPPLPPPRPHRHGRSSSLDLNKFKIGTPSGPQPEIMAQASFDLQTSTGFADFAQFPDDNLTANVNSDPQQMYSLPPQPSTTGRGLPPAAVSLPPTRFSLQSNQRVSAFEVYRKPNTPRNSQSPKPMAATNSAAASQMPPPIPPPFGSAGATALTTLPNSDLYEKRVNAISETLRHVSFKQESNNNMTDVLRHLREQNNLLLRLCNDLSDELLTVQTRKEEMRLQLEASTSMVASNTNLGTQIGLCVRTGSSISAPVTANVTGGSGSSGVHSNV